MKKLLLSCLSLVAFGFAANAQETVTLEAVNATDFAGTYVDEVPAEGNSNGSGAKWQPLESLKIGDYTFTFSKGEGSTEPAYYFPMSTAATPKYTIRVYRNNTMTITGPADVKIATITGTGSNVPTIDGNGTNVVTYTNTSGNNIQFQTITLTLGEGGSQGGDEPVVTPEGAVYEKANAMADGVYAFVANNTVATALAADKKYGYLPVVDATFNGESLVASAECGYTFTAVEGGYTIRDALGRFLYQTGTYNSFNLSTERIDGDLFTVEFTADGVVVTNVAVNKTLQFDPTYNSYGSYPDVRGVYPALYKATGAGIAAIEADNNATAVYYNIHGQRVANPENGLFIRVQGQKVEKVIVR